MRKQISQLLIIPIALGSFLGSIKPQMLIIPTYSQPTSRVLAEKEMSLEDRYQNKFVNDVFKNNILLNLSYMAGKIASAKNINWEEISRPFQYEFKLNPDKTFAYHEDVKDQYQGKVEKTTNAHFNFAEGFKTDGYLFGDGVCHLASLIKWAAKEAGLKVDAPTSHDFADIPDIPKEYGVSIYNTPGSKSLNALQNLYITNNKAKPITFKFEYLNNKVKVSVLE